MSRLPVAVLLLAGANARFWPLQQKSLLAFCGRTLLEHQLGHLADLGLREVIVVANPANQELAQQLLQAQPALHAQVVLQPEPRGMGDALLQAAPLLQGPYAGAPLYLLQPADLVEPSLHEAVLAAWRARPSAGVLAAKRVSDYFPGGYLIVRDGRVEGIVEKPGPGHEPSQLVTLVAHLHPDVPSLLRRLEEEYASPQASDDHYERAVGRLALEREYQVAPYEGPWIALKYPWHLLDAMQHFLAKITEPQVASGAQISPRAEISGPVIIEKEVRVFSGAHLVGPAYVGPGAIIGDNALVRESMIGPGAVIGFSTEVARSYVGRDTWFHTNYIGDSIVDDGASFGSGAVTANLRFDEASVHSRVGESMVDTGRIKLGAMVAKGAKIGVNVTLLPGVKIGQESWIYPGVTVQEDVPSHSYVSAKAPLIVRPNRSSAPLDRRAEFHQRLLGGS